MSSYAYNPEAPQPSFSGYMPFAGRMPAPGLPQSLAQQLMRRRQPMVNPNGGLLGGSIFQNPMVFNHMRQLLPGLFMQHPGTSFVNPDHIAPGILQHLGAIQGAVGAPPVGPPATLPNGSPLPAQGNGPSGPGGSPFMPIEHYPAGPASPGPGATYLGNDNQSAQMGSVLHQLLASGLLTQPVAGLQPVARNQPFRAS